MDRGPTPRPELRAALREALTADRGSFRDSVDRLASEYDFDAQRLGADPETFDPPAAVAPLDVSDREPVWRAWMLAEAPLGVVVAGAAYHDNPVLYANRATRRLTGHSLAALWGENLRRLQGPGTDGAAVDTLRNALRNWNGVTVELRNYRADGTPFTNRVTLVPSPGDDGTVRHWFGLQAAVPAD
ncbi:PAS fold domain-containing protein [Halosimplex carlsbadense 2-9-1]|uniref:PAS fold domain-containing protein n=1 Tax=Halosimplex carlsbadense 2-9-1 TaxID=797114 RepID=M0CPL9_9EURY|nr:PAS domain-containing protein [Halosimplex carlsbadense]ELZ24342.1 PAS fold domain-containing protein [Halosimplex carlsbadense 2-9-1]